MAFWRGYRQMVHADLTSQPRVDLVAFCRISDAIGPLALSAPSVSLAMGCPEIPAAQLPSKWCREDVKDRA